jgi:hypothetical protein
VAAGIAHVMHYAQGRRFIDCHGLKRLAALRLWCPDVHVSDGRPACALQGTRLHSVMTHNAHKIRELAVVLTVLVGTGTWSGESVGG